MMQFKKLCFLVLLLLLAMNAQANYQLDNEASSLHFISVKKNKIGEVNTFKQLNGSINSKGVAEVTIDLFSVQSHIAIRNERLKSMLFETGIFPTAKASATLDVSQLETIEAGQVLAIPLELTLNLHGKSKLIKTNVQVVGLTEGALLVSTIKPIMLNALDFGLSEGVIKLMEVAKLPSISTAVPVSFSLIFKR